MRYGAVAPNYEASILVNSSDPAYCSPRRLSFAERQEVRRIVDDLLMRGIIRHSDSPYASPIVLTKKNGDMRMCVDYRSLNKLIVRDKHTLPVINDCSELGGKTFG